jgi:hypothetical protein
LNRKVKEGQTDSTLVFFPLNPFNIFFSHGRLFEVGANKLEAPREYFVGPLSPERLTARGHAKTCTVFHPLSSACATYTTVKLRPDSGLGFQGRVLKPS